MGLKIPRILLLILIFATLLLFWRISERGINEWDEARNGVNAVEMRQNGDPINLYYGGKLDSWNAKPPLMIWLICCSYNLFGYNAFSLRLPAALSTLGFFVIGFLLLRKSRNNSLAVITCCILLSCKAVIGIHTGLTGDFDALQLFFLTASAYYFWLYCYEGNTQAIFLVASCTGLAWYAKGPASLVLLPGFFLAGCLKEGSMKWIRNYKFWLAGVLLLAIATSWIVIIMIWGKTTHDINYGTGNALRTMFVEDVWHRLTSSNFEGGRAKNYLFFVEAIDVRLNLWNYLFYITITIGLWKGWRHRDDFMIFFRHNDHGMTGYLLCLLLPQILLLTFAANKHDWYVAPAFLSIAYITAKGIQYISIRSKFFKLIFSLLFAFALIRHWVEINSYAKPHAVMSRQAYSDKDTIITIGNIRQDMYLQLKWMNKPILARALNEIHPFLNTLIVADTSILQSSDTSFSLTGKIVDGYYFGVLQQSSSSPNLLN